MPPTDPLVRRAQFPGPCAGAWTDHRLSLCGLQRTRREQDLLSAASITTFRLNGQFLALAEELARPAGLTVAWWQVLGAVLGEPLPVAGIAREMGLARQSVQRVADILVERDLASTATTRRTAGPSCSLRPARGAPRSAGSARGTRRRPAGWPRSSGRKSWPTR
jgi:hypothetical protein